MITLTGVMNDLHLPFHDPRAVSLILDAYEDIGLDRLVINGDLMDFYGVGMHGPKSPLVQATLEKEFEEGHEFISTIRKRFVNKGVEVIYIMGNHEWRLDRFILQHCKPFWNILTVDKMLDISNNDIKIVPYNQEYKLEKTLLRIQHSPPSYSENAAMTCLKKKLDVSHMYGCTHRIQHACKTGGSGNVHNVWLNGWLGSTTLTQSHREVFKYAKGHENWQQGASLVAVVNKRDFHVQQSQFINDRIMFNGHLYEL